MDLFEVYWIIKCLHTSDFKRIITSNYKEPIKCVTLNNQPCQARPTLFNINSDETLLYPFLVSDNKS